LHVLGTPPAFILSQDQTLRKKLSRTLQYVKFGVSLEFHQVLTSYHSSVVKVLEIVAFATNLPEIKLADAQTSTSARQTDKFSPKPFCLLTLVSDAKAPIFLLAICSMARSH
jgi:hypothetical protein